MYFFNRETLCVSAELYRRPVSVLLVYCTAKDNQQTFFLATYPNRSSFRNPKAVTQFHGEPLGVGVK